MCSENFFLGDDMGDVAEDAEVLFVDDLWGLAAIAVEEEVWRGVLDAAQQGRCWCALFARKEDGCEGLVFDIGLDADEVEGFCVGGFFAQGEDVLGVALELGDGEGDARQNVRVVKKGGVGRELSEHGHGRRGGGFFFKMDDLVKIHVVLVDLVEIEERGDGVELQEFGVALGEDGQAAFGFFQILWRDMHGVGGLGDGVAGVLALCAEHGAAFCGGDEVGAGEIIQRALEKCGDAAKIVEGWMPEAVFPLGDHALVDGGVSVAERLGEGCLRKSGDGAGGFQAFGENVVGLCHVRRLLSWV